MAHHGEPMDVDCIESEFDNKENSFHHSNVVPCTEKGYEELDVSELNMKLRYSITPSSSPMSKSYTAYVDNRNLDSDQLINCTNENANLTRSLNSTMTNNDNVIKSLKSLPLQTISNEQILDNRGSVLRQLDSTITVDDNNVTVTISETNDINENLSLPSSSSSVVHTPEATTPTNFKNEEGSPIIRGLKSVFNMFRSSQSPIPPVEVDNSIKEDVRPLDETYCEDPKPQTHASTPISAHRSRDGSSKRSSPLKDSIVFNEDLEMELQWKEDTILFSEEKIPIHKLFLPQNKPTPAVVTGTLQKHQEATEDTLDLTTEYMDISHINSIMLDKTVTETHNAVESDGEFQDCETTFTKNESQSIITKEDEIKKKTSSETLEDVDVLSEMINETKTTVNENIENKHHKIVIDASQTMDITEKVIFENPLTAIEATGKEENMLIISTSSVIDTIRDIIDNVTSVNSDSNETAIEIESDINDNRKCIDNETQNKPSIDTSKTLDLTVEIQHANVPDISKCDILIAASVIESMSADINAELPLKSIENSTEILLDPKTDGAPSIIGVENLPEEVKELNIIENENISINEVNQVILPEIDGETTLNNENKFNVSIDPEDVFILDKNDEIEDSQKTIKNCQIFENQDVDAEIISLEKNASLPENPTEVLNNMSLVSENSIPITLAEEPANIPLLDNDDFDIDLKLNTDEVIPTLQAPPDVLDMVNAEPKLNDIETSSIVSLQAPPDVLDTVKAEQKLDVTETLNDMTITENSIAGCTEVTTQKHDVLNDTVDIVNSLTEIIGESLNTTLTQSVNIMPNASLNEQMVEMEFTDEINILPDIVNETVHNMSVDEILPEITNQSQLVGEMDNIPKVAEMVFDVKPEENNPISEDFSTSVINNATEQSSDSINTNKEHTDTIDVLTKVIDVVPEANSFESNSNEAENTSKKIEVLDVDVIQNPGNVDSKFDEELIFSENNSPYVSVMAETDSKATQESLENIDIPSNVTSVAPSSPPIRSRGYNFNFDEMDDPFATKMKIRQSPSPSRSTLKKPDSEDKNNPGAFKKVAPNRRRSQPPESKNPAFNKKKLNATFQSNATYSPNNKSMKDLNYEGEFKNVTADKTKNITITIDSNNEDDEEVAMILDSTQLLDNLVKNIYDTSAKNVNSEEQSLPTADTTVEISIDNKSSIESLATATSEIKTSSSEQSTYYSAAASSSDNSISRNVFNLPEIDDKNFNPFATKSKMRQSPPLAIERENPFATKSKMRSSPDYSMVALPNTDSAQITTQNIVKEDGEDKMDTELMEKDSSYNVNNITSSSKETDDKNVTVREVNTEDEDTEEGPFLEAEDAIDKLLGIDNDDMMQFNEIPAQAIDENADGGELFIDAEAFEFLLNKNKSNVVSDSGKESLFLKFDPLFARISSDGVLSALNKVQKRQSTPTKPTRPSLRNEASPIAGPSTLNATYNEKTNVTEDSIEDLNVTVAKPMMVVTPAVNPAVTPRNKTTTPPRSNRRSITFTSPAMAVIDRLISLSANNSLLGQDTTITQASREHIEADLALTQLRELLAEKEISVYQLRSESKELRDRLTTMEAQVKILEADGQERLNKINELNDLFAEKTKVNKSMAAVVEEYERTIASLIAETEQDKKRHAEERNRLINERDEQTAHLASMEVSFSDLHSKYEKSKQVILSCKANEDAYKKTIKDFEENLTKMQTNYEMLKQHATSKLNNANHELQKITRSHESEVLKLNAMIKRKEMHLTSLEETLAQKTKANEELTAICDELINRVG